MKEKSPYLWCDFVNYLLVNKKVREAADINSHVTVPVFRGCRGTTPADVPAANATDTPPACLQLLWPLWTAAVTVTGSTAFASFTGEVVKGVESCMALAVKDLLLGKDLGGALLRQISWFSWIVFSLISTSWGIKSFQASTRARANAKSSDLIQSWKKSHFCIRNSRNLTAWVLCHKTTRFPMFWNDQPWLHTKALGSPLFNGHERKHLLVTDPRPGTGSSVGDPIALVEKSVGINRKWRFFKRQNWCPLFQKSSFLNFWCENLGFLPALGRCESFPLRPLEKSSSTCPRMIHRRK